MVNFLETYALALQKDMSIQCRSLQSIFPSLFVERRSVVLLNKLTPKLSGFLQFGQLSVNVFKPAI